VRGEGRWEKGGGGKERGKNSYLLLAVTDRTVDRRRKREGESRQRSPLTRDGSSADITSKPRKQSRKQGEGKGGGKPLILHIYSSVTSHREEGQERGSGGRGSGRRREGRGGRRTLSICESTYRAASAIVNIEKMPNLERREKDGTGRETGRRKKKSTYFLHAPRRRVTILLFWEGKHRKKEKGKGRLFSSAHAFFLKVAISAAVHEGERKGRGRKAPFDFPAHEPARTRGVDRKRGGRWHHRLAKVDCPPVKECHRKEEKERRRREARVRCLKSVREGLQAHGRNRRRKTLFRSIFALLIRNSNRRLRACTT